MAGHVTYVWVFPNVSSYATCTLYASMIVQVAQDEPQVLNSDTVFMKHKELKA